jgi:hypothetical protein
VGFEAELLWCLENKEESQLRECWGTWPVSGRKMARIGGYGEGEGLTWTYGEI